MRIAYVTWQPLHRGDGVVRKIAAQARAWRRRGHKVRLFGMSRFATLWPGAADVPHRLVPGGTLWQRAGRARRLVDSVLAWRPELVFFRLAAYYPALDRLMRSAATVVDINTNDLLEMRRALPRWQFAYYRHFRQRLLRQARGITAVTEELAAALPATGAAAAVISNGIDLSQYPSLPAAGAARPQLFFLGSPRRVWHGTDKIIQLARLRPQWQFHLVGPSSRDLGVRLPPNVRPHGPLQAKDYLPIMARCDAAIGSLAMHRNAMAEACPLKVREYLAYGLPVIAGYQDTDFPTETDFFLCLDNTPDNISQGLAKIDRLVHAWRNHRVPRRDIRHLDLMRKEQERLEFFGQVWEACRDVGISE